MRHEAVRVQPRREVLGSRRPEDVSVTWEKTGGCVTLLAWAGPHVVHDAIYPVRASTGGSNVRGSLDEESDLDVDLVEGEFAIVPHIGG